MMLLAQCDTDAVSMESNNQNIMLHLNSIFLAYRMQ